jgi:hypothetical protein
MSEDKLPSGVGGRFGDLSEIPDELRSKIVRGRLDELENKIVNTMQNRFDGAASVDELMVGLYRDHKYITEDRKILANKLYRMQKSGVIDSVENRRGIYKIKDADTDGL